MATDQRPLPRRGQKGAIGGGLYPRKVGRGVEEDKGDGREGFGGAGG